MLGVSILRQKSTNAISLRHEFILFAKLPLHHYFKLLRLRRKSKAQLRQDMFVISTLKFKKNGFFVEFGATNGVDLSNTYLLAKEFGWTGILAEPASIWHKDLKTNRSESKIEFRCVWKNSGSTLSFNETEYPELSTIDEFSNNDRHTLKRETGKKYLVETISLNDLLDTHNAPKIIDYLSIDTEGSEFEILSSLDFSKFKFRVITCEHNHSPQRVKIQALLQKNGYRQVLKEVSKFDDWYILEEINS
jgi:FkbM family methyltransferase